jgi:hypothetical protein
MTEKKAKSAEKRKFHCACATGDLSEVQPVTVPSTSDATRPPDGKEASGDAAGAATADHPRTKESKP